MFVLLERAAQPPSPPPEVKLVKVQGQGAPQLHAQPPTEDMRPAKGAAACVHDWAHYELPAEKGRVVQCSRCGAIGFRRSRMTRFGLGHGKVQLYACVKPGCGKQATARLKGRGARGSYLWVCADHDLVVERAGSPA